MTDFAAAFLQICSDICGISYCFAVKIYHGQHSSNIVITFLTSRTIVRLQTNIWWHQCRWVLQKVAPAPDSNRTSTSQRCLFDVCIYICKTYFLGCLLICNMSPWRFSSDVKQTVIRMDVKLLLRRLSDYKADVSQIFSRRLTDVLLLSG